MPCDHRSAEVAIGAGISWCCRCGSVTASAGTLLGPPRDATLGKCGHLRIHTSTVSSNIGVHEWCRECGSVRRLKRDGQPATRWTRPGGPYAKNPGELKLLPPKRKPVETDEG